MNLLPSCMLIGPSGGGKTNGIAQLIMAGFNVCLIPIEDKHAGLNRLKPLRIPIPDPEPGTGRLPSATTKYDRMWRFVDGLAQGKYREHNGKPIDILANDGLMEASFVIAKHMRGKFQQKESIKIWQGVADKTMEWFHALRDASGYGAYKMGHKPLGIVATCGEGSPKKVDVKAGGSYTDNNIPLLQGNVAETFLPFQFEVIWRLTAGASVAGGEHVFRVQTVLYDNTPGKSPGGVFDKFIEGPGGLDDDGKPRTPDIGWMYRQLLTNPRSAFYHGPREEVKES